MSIDDILKEAKALGFNEKIERHYVCDVYREARRAAVRGNGEEPDAYAAKIARQYMREEIDKWQRRGYKKL